MALSLRSLLAVRKKERTWTEGGWEMKMRTAGSVQRIGFAALAFALAFLACGAAMATEGVRHPAPLIPRTCRIPWRKSLGKIYASRSSQVISRMDGGRNRMPLNRKTFSQ